MKRFSILAAALGVLLASAPLVAQEQEMQRGDEEVQAWLDLIRVDIREEKASFVWEAMELSPEEEAVFRPIYEEYEADLKKIWDSNVELIEAYAASYESLTDEVASSLGEWAMELEVQRIQLLRETFRTMSEQMSSRRAARFIQIENQIDMLVSMEIAARLPLVKTP